MFSIFSFKNKLLFLLVGLVLIPTIASADVFTSSETVTISARVVDPNDNSGNGSSGSSGGGIILNTPTTINFSGKASPFSKIIILNNGFVFSNTSTTDKNGNFLISFSGLLAGIYNFSVYSIDANGRKSQSISFSLNIAAGSIVNVSGLVLVTIVPPKDEVNICGTIKSDINCDNKVDLTDFSILAYWYKKSNPPKSVDLNGDGKVNLIDFSIMAFYWTG